MDFDDSSSHDVSLLVDILSEMVTEYLVLDQEVEKQETKFSELNANKK